MTRTRRIWALSCIAALMWAGCSDESKISNKTEWLCEYDQHEKPDVNAVPEGEDLEDYVDPEILAYLEDNDTEEFDAEFIAELQEALEPMIQGGLKAEAAHTDCTIDDVKVDGDWARVDFERTTPELDLDLEVFEEFDEDDDVDEIEARYREWFAESDEKTTTEHTLAFRNTDDGWRAHHGIEHMELQEELDDLEEQLEELRQDIDDRDEAKEKLADFVVHSVELRQVSQGRYLSDTTAIDLEVENNTDHAISRVYFDAEYASPDRQVPWEAGSFNYSVSGGVEPGESAEWSLEPNMMSDWYETRERDGAELHVDVIELEGPDGDTLWEIPSAYDDSLQFGSPSTDDDFDTLEEQKEHFQQQAEQLRDDIAASTPEILQ